MWCPCSCYKINTYLKDVPQQKGIAFKSKVRIYNSDGLNIFYSGRKYTEKDWVRLKKRHYPLQYNSVVPIDMQWRWKEHLKRKPVCIWWKDFDFNIFYSCIEYTETDWVQLKVSHYPLQKGLWCGVYNWLFFTSKGFWKTL